MQHYVSHVQLGRVWPGARAGLKPVKMPRHYLYANWLELVMIFAMTSEQVGQGP